MFRILIPGPLVAHPAAVSTACALYTHLLVRSLASGCTQIPARSLTLQLTNNKGRVSCVDQGCTGYVYIQRNFNKLSY